MMPTNIKKLLAKEFKQLTDQATGRVRGRAKNKAANKLYADLKREVKNGNTKDASQIIAGPVADIHAQISRRFLELLAIDTPKDTGELNGGWTSGNQERTAYNITHFPFGEDLTRIIRFAEAGAHINIRNAVEYAGYVNYGINQAKSRRFVETAIAQVQAEASKMGITVNVTGG